MKKRKKAVLVISFSTIICIILSCIVFIILKNNTNLFVKSKNAIINIKSSDEKIIDVPSICQYPTLPTGCESVAATMVLKYYNDVITSEKFANEWLKINDNFYSFNGKKYGPDPNKVFVGDPFSKNSYGCYATPIVDAINKNSENCIAQKISNIPLETLCKEYIDNEKPLLIWATVGMKKSDNGNSWYLENDTEFTWIAGEHCLVLVGYNKEYYFLNDPTSGSVVAYQKEIVKKRFEELGSQVVYIHRK